MRVHALLFPSLMLCIGCGLMSGCTGRIGSPDAHEGEFFNSSAPNNGSPTPSPGHGSPGASSLGNAASGGDGAAPPPDAALRRLTRLEYNRTLHDLLGDTSAPADGLPPDDASIGFAVASDITTTAAQYLLDAAENAANGALARGVFPGTLCNAVPDNECGTRLVRTIGPKAWRRPLSAEEESDLTQVYQSGASGGGTVEGARLLLTALLVSPAFLYHVELGAEDVRDDGLARLGSYEVASRLSYLMWNTMPDDALLSEAAAGRLASPSDVEAQARKMVTDERSASAFVDFHMQWLGLTRTTSIFKDTSLFPRWSHDLAASAQRETEEFVRSIFVAGDARYSTLLTAPYSFVDSALASLYGIPMPAASMGMARVSLDPTVRKGVLTQASVLATYASANQNSIVRRGKLVREQLLCQNLPAPPPNIPALKPPAPGLSLRARTREHEADATCAACHRLIDPLGLPFEQFDATGAFRTMDGDELIDATGNISQTSDADGPVRGVPGLADRLAGSADVRSCVAKKWFRYAFGRLETDSDADAIAQGENTLSATRGDVRELLVSFTRSNQFLFRKAIRP